ncbi:MAG: hypothetical protein ACRD88_21635, partial [Terriglobia bacterium]
LSKPHQSRDREGAVVHPVFRAKAKPQLACPVPRSAPRCGTKNGACARHSTSLTVRLSLTVLSKAEWVALSLSKGGSDLLVTCHCPCYRHHDMPP